MVVSLIELKPGGKRAEILELLRYSADHITTKPGCLSSGVYYESEAEGTILYVERWSREEDFRRHVQSDLYMGVLTALDLAMDRREVNFYEVSDTKSMEFIVAVRNAN
jgi:quinol monooxygenase YgiN